jgi:hypothetical protein
LRASLSAFFNETDSNVRAKSLAYALAHLPTKTFATISLSFTRHSRLDLQPFSEIVDGVSSHAVFKT